MHGWWEPRQVASLNFADLPPNPAPAKKWQEVCSFVKVGATWIDCATIDEVVMPYKYRVSPPPAVLNYDPALKTCKHAGDVGIINPFLDTWDPPHPLVGKPALAVPTLTSIESTFLESPAPVPSRTTMFNPPTARQTTTKSSNDSPVPSHDGGVNIVDPPAPLQQPKPDGSVAGDSGISGPNTPSHPPKPTYPIAIITIESSIYTAKSGNLALPDTTLSLGKPAATISGHLVSLATNGVAVDGTLKSFITTGPSDPDAVITIGSSAYTAQSNRLVLPGITLAPGDPGASISGHVVSLVSDGVVVDGTLTPFVNPSSRTKIPEDLIGDLIMFQFTHTEGAPAATSRAVGQSGTDLEVNGTATLSSSVIATGSGERHTPLRTRVYYIMSAFWVLWIL